MIQKVLEYVREPKLTILEKLKPQKTIKHMSAFKGYRNLYRNLSFPQRSTVVQVAVHRWMGSCNLTPILATGPPIQATGRPIQGSV